MIDFKLTENGDIDIADAYQYPYFIIKYYISTGTESKNRYPAFKIDFDVDAKKYEQPGERFLIQFRTQKRIVPYKTVTVKSVTGNKELAQEVTIRLKTEQGEFQFLTELGSQLVTLRHNDIKSEITKELIQQYASEAISDVEFEDTYEIKTAWEEDNDSRYKHERLKVTIDTDRNTIYEATI